MNKEFKILSIDGGGIKGLYGARVLQSLEQKYDCKIADYFDMICGTSTGGLIALGLSIEKPASELVKLYTENGKYIFPYSKYKIGRVFRFLKQMLYKGKFSNEALRKALVAEFGEKTLREVETLLCIPSFNLTMGMPRMFKYPHKEGKFFKDKDISLVDAALATSAAPTYLPIHELENALYADGGVWANNPSLCGMLEALEYFVGPNKEFDSYSILSISSIAQPTGWSYSFKKNRSFIDWRDKLFQTSMDGQAYFTDFYLKKAVNFTKAQGYYYRIPSPKLSSEQMNVITMDRTDEKAIKMLTMLGQHHGDQYCLQPEVERFFETKKQYKTQ